MRRRGDEAGASKDEPLDIEESSVDAVTLDETRVDTTARTPDACGTMREAGRRSSTTVSQPGKARAAGARRQPALLAQAIPGTSGTGRGEDQSGARGPSAAESTSASAFACARGLWLADLITNPDWRAFLSPITADEWRGGTFGQIARFLEKEKASGKVILPPAELTFSAFNSCPFAELKVVLLGQDPYHNLKQAHGLCFSVLPGVPIPPSLKNMYKELTTDIPGFQAPTHGYLQSWSEQGMLMLNATLTVEAHSPNSHSKTSGWSHFTDAVIAHLSAHHPNRLVFLLWGHYAQQKRRLIDTHRHVVIDSVHPSPLSASRGWFGCHCFSACNTALRGMGHTPMYWQLPLQVHGG